MADERANLSLSLVFDGGSKGNPGFGYGSYWLQRDQEEPTIVRLEFGDGVTNNQAEYRSLIAGLEAALAAVAEHELEPRRATLKVRSDSRLVIEQVQGRWKVKNDELRVLCDRARAIAARFGTVDFGWHRRDTSVRLLGH